MKFINDDDGNNDDVDDDTEITIINGVNWEVMSY
jgi:hypothetical protein